MLSVMRVGKQARWTEDLPIRACRKILKPHFPLHWHEFFEIELIISGHGHCVLNGKPYDLNPGDLYLLTTTDFHEVYADNIEVLHLTFDQSMIDAGMTEKIISAGKNLFFHLDEKEYEKFYNYMSLVIEECEAQDGYRHDFVSHLMQCIFILMLRKVELKDTEKSKHCPPVAAAISYLELHFRESPDLQTVSDHVHLNKNYFCSLFREETGKTMVRYVNDLKLSYSRNLLKSTNISITEICFNCGFNSFSNFIHEFKQKYGETPLQCRKNEQTKG